MTKRPAGKGRKGADDAAAPVVAAAEFKATCLELMDRVRETGVEYVVTKHGQPVARLVPYDGAARPLLFGALKGTVLKFDRPFDPVEGDYDVDRA
jgi:prevent-host-death family protein